MKPKTWAHPKFALLQKRLGICQALAAGILEGIWYLAATFDAENGKLPYSDAELAAWLGVDLEPAALLAGLVDGRWVDVTDTGLRVHGWAEHKPTYIKDAERKRSYRKTTLGTVRDNPCAAYPSDSDSDSDSEEDTWSMDQERARGDVEPDMDQKRKEEKTKTTSPRKPRPAPGVAVTIDAVARQSRDSHKSVTSLSQEICDGNVTEALPEKRRPREEKIHGPCSCTGEDARVDQKREGKPEKTKTRKKPKPTPGHQVRTAVTVDAIADQAAAIFDALGYRGDQGGNVWGVAALLETGIGELSEAEVFSACRGAKLNGADRPAHFFATLSETLEKRDENLTQLLRQVTILPAWPKEKPRSPDTRPSGDDVRNLVTRSLADPPDTRPTERTPDDIRRELENAIGERIEV